MSAIFRGGFGAFFFLVTLRTIIEWFGKSPVVAFVDDDAFHFFDFLAAGVAFHPLKINKQWSGSQTYA